MDYLLYLCIMVQKLEQIIDCLGTPYYQNEYGAIYCMDCREGLAKIPRAIVDSTITSPPYNIGKEYEQQMPVDAYIEWLSGVINDVYEVTDANGSLLLNLGYLSIEGKARALPIPYLLWDKIAFFLQQEIVWNYSAGVACKKFLSPRNEKICWYVKNQDCYTFNLDAIRDPDVLYPNQKKNGKLRCNTIGKNPSDVWRIAKVTSGTNRASSERTPHPAQFPEDLVTRMIKGFTNEGDIVLDPFMGSGTVAAVAMDNDRFFIGFEVVEAYCEIARQRLIERGLDNKYDLFRVERV